MPSLIDLVNQYREDLLNNDVRAMSRLARAYSASYKSLLLEVNKLTKIVESGTYTASQVHRLTRYKTTVAQVAGELSRMQALTIEEVNAAANIGIKLGDVHARGLIAATVGSEQLAIAFNKLDPQLTRALLGFLDPNGQLYQRMNELSNFNADLISQNLTDGIIKGFNPQKIARMFTSGWGMALADSMRMVRTAQLYSYREASRATYLANSGVVQQWQWSAFHSPSTCVMCISMDGTIHDMDESLHSHYNCRCAMIPVVKGFPLTLDRKAGEQWFSDQTSAIQRDMLGKGKYNAWKNGEFNLSDLGIERPDDVYGLMWNEKTLKELLGR